MYWSKQRKMNEASQHENRRENNSFTDLVDALLAECDEAELVYGAKNPLNIHSETIRELIKQHGENNAGF